MPIQECGPLTVSPPTAKSPLEAGINPPMILNNVDLPQPDGPMMEKNSPALTSRETLFKAQTSSTPLSAPPKVLLTLRKLKIAMSFSVPEHGSLRPTDRRI